MSTILKEYLDTRDIAVSRIIMVPDLISLKSTRKDQQGVAGVGWCWLRQAPAVGAERPLNPSWRW